MIRAITFDLWDTIVIDNSDEPKRAAQGLDPKGQMRIELFVAEVRAHHFEIGRKRAEEAFVHATNQFNYWWKMEHRTPSVMTRLESAFSFLEVPPTPGVNQLAHALENMEVEIPPELAPGIRPCLEALHGNFKLGIISDAIVTPGTGLRKILEHHGLLHFFDVFVFSDEAGAAKPSQVVFRRAISEFDIEPDELIHIGDRETNDVEGPLDFGSHGILYTGVIDRGGSHKSRASAVYRHHDQLTGILDGLQAGIRGS
jgi:putative hydrolase of the HAD superfamily